MTTPSRSETIPDRPVHRSDASQSFDQSRRDEFVKPLRKRLLLVVGVETLGELAQRRFASFKRCQDIGDRCRDQMRRPRSPVKDCDQGIEHDKPDRPPRRPAIRR